MLIYTIHLVGLLLDIYHAAVPCNRISFIGYRKGWVLRLLGYLAFDCAAVRSNALYSEQGLMARQEASDRISTLPPVATPFGVVHVGQLIIISMLKIDILIVSSINNYMDSTKATITVRKENASIKYGACVSCVNRKRNKGMMTCDRE